MIVPTVRLHLEVLADHVHAHALHGFNVKFERIISSCCVDTIGVIALKLQEAVVFQHQPKLTTMICLSQTHHGRMNGLFHAAVEGVNGLHQSGT